MPGRPATHRGRPPNIQPNPCSLSRNLSISKPPVHQWTSADVARHLQVHEASPPDERGLVPTRRDRLYEDRPARDPQVVEAHRWSRERSGDGRSEAETATWSPPLRSTDKRAFAPELVAGDRATVDSVGPVGDAQAPSPDVEVRQRRVVADTRTAE